MTENNFGKYIGKMWFELNPRLHRVLGRCTMNKGFIEISTNIPQEEIEDTISHEMAHYIAYHEFRDAGHGLFWKMVHRKLGGNAQRVAKGINYKKNKVKRVIIEKDGKEYKITQQYFKKISHVLVANRIVVKGVVTIDRNVP